MTTLEHSFLSKLSDHLIGNGGIRDFVQVEADSPFYREIRGDAARLFTRAEIDEIDAYCDVRVINIVYGCSPGGA